jgi:MFS family permease
VTDRRDDGAPATGASTTGAPATAATATAVEAPARRASLGSRYWRLWSASVVSNLGDGVDVAALPLLAATLTRDPRLVAGMAVAVRLPWLLFALPAGAIVDRLDRRKVMYRANILRAALIAVIAVSVVTDTTSIWLLYAVSFGLGTAETLFDNAAQSIMPSVVRADQLEVANGRLYAAETVTNTFVGPPLGGVLFAVAASVPFWLDSASFLVAALLVATIAGTYRPERPPGPASGDQATKRTLRRDIAEGVGWLRHHRLLRTLAIVLGASNFAQGLGMATAVLFAQEILGLGDAGFGLLLAAMAVGSVLGGLFGARIVAALGPGRSLVASIAGFGFPTAAVGLASNAFVVAGLFWIAGIFIVVWNIITVSLRQQLIPDHLLGRVNSVYRFVGWGSIPVGAFVGGVVAEAFGLRAGWLISGLVIAVTLVLAMPRLTTKAIDEAKRTAAAAASES